MRNKLSSLRNNNGMRNEEGEINSAVRTNLISTGSFSFDLEQEWNAKSLSTGNGLRCKEKLLRKLKPQNSELRTRTAEQDKITEEKQKEKQWSSNKTEKMVKVRMSR